MRIVVMGAGGVGGYFGAKLARAGHPITLVARGAHLEAIRRDGLRIRSAAEGEFVARPDAVADLRGRPPADAVLLCVKGFDTETAVEQLRPVVGPETPVLSLQNGVSATEVIDRVLGPGHALGGAAYVFAFREGPGVIVHQLLGRIALGELDGRIHPARPSAARRPGRRRHSGGAVPVYPTGALGEVSLHRGPGGHDRPHAKSGRRVARDPGVLAHVSGHRRGAGRPRAARRAWIFPAIRWTG